MDINERGLLQTVRMLRRELETAQRQAGAARIDRYARADAEGRAIALAGALAFLYEDLNLDPETGLPLSEEK